MIGGDSFPINKICKWSTMVDNLYNTMGATELSCICSTFKWNENTEFNNVEKPVFNSKYYILNKNLKQVPIGIIGELYSSGTLVGRGYLNRNDLTNERFIINPFEENSKLYKTGDLARFLENGDVEYIGRIDNQIKLRGLRIELEEIEFEIKKISNILNCVVILREDEINEKYLASYIILKNEIENKIEFIQTIKKQISKKLPNYMIPKSFTILKLFPLNSSDKIDKKKFPKPDLNDFLTNLNEYIEPKTEIEIKLVEIWKEILHLNKIGIEDNFFEIGGDSISLIMIKSKCLEIGINFTYNQFYSNPKSNNKKYLKFH
jgi:acyl-CoA synthetase (AMP-forming)/AMP-acid ligase II